MFGVIGQLMGSLGQASLYDAKKREAAWNAELTREKGRDARAATNREARSVFETDKANKEIRAQQQRQVRREETLAQSGARAAAAGSGVNVEAGRTSEDEVRRAYDERVANLAQSSSIAHANAMQRALAMRGEGDSAAAWAEVEAVGYDAQAAQYGALARRTRAGALGSALASVAAGAYGGYVGYQEGGLRGLARGVQAYGTMGWDVTATMNPYIAGHTVDLKESYTDLAALLQLPKSVPGAEARRETAAEAARGYAPAGGLGAYAGGEEGVSTSFDDGYLPAGWYNDYQRGLRV